ncbi:tyrosine-type recombinase/integrase, partial [Cereibacter sphaeroides]|uniref:tyrosine-type recombinase/integrase n=1 Tax=Cereibacter sphaeroides TaxID=1063 RepID=UPI001F281118
RSETRAGDSFGQQSASAAPAPVESAALPVLSDAVGRYVALTGRARPQSFHNAVARVSALLVKLCGDKPVDGYTRSDACKFRDHLVNAGVAGSTIIREINTVRAILNFAASEAGAPQTTAFSKLYVDAKAGTTERQPFSMPQLQRLKTLCREANDERRWLLALVADTGLRLGEAVGLLRSDFRVVDGVPAVVIQPHPWRRLKNASSKRVVPLVGEALWASQRIFGTTSASPFAFPSYNDGKTSHTNSASATLNKWMANNGLKGVSVHSLRHSFRDRCRRIVMPIEMVNQVGGWSDSANVGSSYGNGYTADVLRDWLKKLVAEPRDRGPRA